MHGIKVSVLKHYSKVIILGVKVNSIVLEAIEKMLEDKDKIDSVIQENKVKVIILTKEKITEEFISMVSIV